MNESEDTKTKLTQVIGASWSDKNPLESQKAGIKIIVVIPETQIATYARVFANEVILLDLHLVSGNIPIVHTEWPKGWYWTNCPHEPG